MSDHKHKFSIYQMVKDLTRAAFNPATQHLLAIRRFLPLELWYLWPFISKSVSMPTFKSEVNKFIVTRPYLYTDLTLEKFSKKKAFKFLSKLKHMFLAAFVPYSYFLQLHSTYKLNLTFSPCCACLTEDNSVEHFLFRCSSYQEVRKTYNPRLNTVTTIRTAL